MNTTTTPTDHGQATPEQVALILADCRSNDWVDGDMTDAEVLDYVFDTLTLPGQAAMGADEIEDDASALYVAYFAFLARTPEDVAAYQALTATPTVPLGARNVEAGDTILVTDARRPFLVAAVTLFGPDSLAFHADGERGIFVFDVDSAVEIARRA